MLVGVLTALGVLGAIGLLVVLFLQRGRDGVDLSLGGLLRLYLYLASLAGVIAFAVGLAGIISYILAAAFGLDLVYGGQIPRPVPAIAPACAPNTTCPPFVTPLQQVITDPRIRQKTDDLVRGVTFVIFGGVVWGAHGWAGRAGAQPQEHRREDPARQDGRDHGSVGFGEVIPRLRHDLCGGTAPLRRVALGLRASIPWSDGEAGRRLHRGPITRGVDRSEGVDTQPAAARRDRRGDLP